MLTGTRIGPASRLPFTPTPYVSSGGIQHSTGCADRGNGNAMAVGDQTLVYVGGAGGLLGLDSAETAPQRASAFQTQEQGGFRADVTSHVTTVGRGCC